MKKKITKPFKQIEGKLRFDLIPPEMDKAFAEVATFGINKLSKLGVENAERNWEQGIRLVRDHLGAMKRHINSWELGVNDDPESKLSHMKHALWHIAAIVAQLDRKRNDLDDRTSGSLYQLLKK
jgi:hypothetical protein